MGRDGRRSVRPRRAAAVVVALGVGASLLAAPPASAVTPPAWETGRVPQGCNTEPSIGPTATGFELQINDLSDPRVSGWTVSGSRKRLLLTPNGTRVDIRARAINLCGGLAAVTMTTFYNDAITGPGALIPVTAENVTSNVFDGEWSYSYIRPEITTGWFMVPTVTVRARYTLFTLDENLDFLRSAARQATPIEVRGAWSSQRIYLTLKTIQTATASRSTVPRGGRVTFTTTVKRTGATAYVPHAGVGVRFQTRAPGGVWTTRATVATTSTGRASYTFAPSATLQWRFVLPENLTTVPYTAPSTTPARTVTVT